MGSPKKSALRITDEERERETRGQVSEGAYMFYVIKLFLFVHILHIPVVIY
jgi:hypothetical protein